MQCSFIVDKDDPDDVESLRLTLKSVDGFVFETLLPRLNGRALCKLKDGLASKFSADCRIAYGELSYVQISGTHFIHYIESMHDADNPENVTFSCPMSDALIAALEQWAKYWADLYGDRPKKRAKRHTS